MIRELFFVLLVVPGVVFAGSDSWWQQDGKECEQAIEDAGYKLMYPKEGHFNTTGVVAKIAGYSPEEAARLACYSQMPDAEVWRLSATAVGIWGIFTQEYRHLIVADLHSLHGGNGAAVESRRENLARLLKQGVKDGMPFWKLGFMIHAMGDSHAHVSGSGKKIKAYGPAVGHVFAFCEKPDVIAHADNFTHYEEYVRALYEVLKTDSARPEKLEEFVSAVATAAKTGKEKEVITAIENFKVYSSGQKFSSLMLFERPPAMNAQKKATKQEEKEFLRWLRTQLES